MWVQGVSLNVQFETNVSDVPQPRNPATPRDLVPRRLAAGPGHLRPGIAGTPHSARAGTSFFRRKRTRL